MPFSPIFKYRARIFAPYIMFLAVALGLLIPGALQMKKLKDQNLFVVDRKQSPESFKAFAMTAGGAIILVVVLLAVFIYKPYDKPYN